MPSRLYVTSIEKLTNANPEVYLTQPAKLIFDSWKRNQEVGSSTLVVVTLPKTDSKIHYSYVGDSGFVILRKREDSKFSVVHASKSQQRKFNFPYQLGWNMNGDHPSVAVNGHLDVLHDDVLVVATDGVLDNIDPQGVETLDPDRRGRQLCA